MTAKLKFPLICASAALFLSFLLGLISGVRWSSIIIRSLIISAISGSFVLGAHILLDHFVPDLFQPLNVQEPEKKEAGKNVNISLDEPIEVSFESDNEISKDLPTESNPNETNEDSVLSDNEVFNNLESRDSNVTEKLSNDNITKDNGVSSSNENAADVKIKKQEKEPLKELEELPDLEDFISEDEPETGEDNTDFTQRGTGVFDVSTDLAGSGMDTNNIVSAIRTVLRRDS